MGMSSWFDKVKGAYKKVEDELARRKADELERAKSATEREKIKAKYTIERENARRELAEAQIAAKKAEIARKKAEKEARELGDNFLDNITNLFGKKKRSAPTRRRKTAKRPARKPAARTAKRSKSTSKGRSITIQY